MPYDALLTQKLLRAAESYKQSPSAGVIAELAKQLTAADEEVEASKRQVRLETDSAMREKQEAAAEKAKFEKLNAELTARISAAPAKKARAAHRGTIVELPAKAPAAVGMEGVTYGNDPFSAARSGHHPTEELPPADPAGKTTKRTKRKTA